MKKQMALITLIATSMFSISASPDGKSAARVDFNKMIDENNHRRVELHHGVKHVAQDGSSVTKDKVNVVDFIDVEIGLGQAPQMVDRRFDSIGEATVVDLNSLIK